MGRKGGYGWQMSNQALQFRPCDWPDDYRYRMARKHGNGDGNFGSRGLELTYNVLAISKLFLNDPPRWLSGMEVCRVLGLRPSTAYGTLERMEAANWLQSHRNMNHDPGGPRNYRITGHGHQSASMALAFLREACT